jgi:hypothetical protein
MRRALLILLVLAGFGILIWALRQPRRTRTTESSVEDRVTQRPVEDVMEPAESVVDIVPETGNEEADPTLMEIVVAADDLDDLADVRPTDEHRAEDVMWASPRVDEAEELLVELTHIRRDVVERVDREPLFAMAEQRGVPFFRLFFMTKPELFEAVLEAEGVPPADVLPSAASAERVRILAAEALALQSEAASLDQTDREAG